MSCPNGERGGRGGGVSQLQLGDGRCAFVFALFTAFMSLRVVMEQLFGGKRAAAVVPPNEGRDPPS
jgi:hypothetical protein